MTKTNAAFRIPPSAFWAVAIVLVYFIGLNLPLVGPDEPRYAQVAREMFERGDWITPMLGGFNWFEKPALLYWLQIASYNLFGVSEFAARFGSALFGLGTVACLWILGRHIETTNNEPRTPDRFANWLALIGSSTVGIIAFAHGASFDIILTFPITAAMVSFFIYDSNGRTLPLVAFYFFIGLALLAKGLVGMIFPFAIVSFYYVLVWKLPSRSFVISLFWGTLLAAAIASLWYVPMYLRHGYEFIDLFFVQHHFQRFTSNKYLHPQPFHFFFWVLPLMTIPWIPFFFASLWNFAKGIKKGGGSADVTRRLRLFALAWIAVPLVFFSFSGSKLPGYILPVVPAAMILAGEYIYRFVQKSDRRRYAIQAVAAVTFGLVVVVASAVAPNFAEADSVKGLFEEADDRGLRDAPVIMLHGISHNAEFYAAGRIVRDAEGKQKRLLGPAEVLHELRSQGLRTALVIVPLDYRSQLLTSELFRSELVKENAEFALVVVYDD
jgi:4-amino-4-deoxy-L-arabinose transferase-like glycosyltransferase